MGFVIRLRDGMSECIYNCHYEFLVMSFGPNNAPSSFQALMNAVLSHYSGEALLVLRRNQLYAKMSKCRFVAFEIEYLGHCISKGTVAMDSSIGFELLPTVQESWQRDPRLKKIYFDIQVTTSLHPKHSWDGKFLRRRGKITVGTNEELRKELIDYFHNSALGGHSGVQATRNRLPNFLY
ncbi:reverse transcriptase [Gossypium australe]|uniref:Reverse transcriptase n=1 Tax=Gossypium australe TaxID=47621 RepID=A0A5B6VE23_9ROSI|nr:reverse transcriptase [Gossypium australe]